MRHKTKVFSEEIKATVISWKDERWSADKETLAAINKMLNKDSKRKSNLFSKLNPQTLLMWFFYGVGFVLEGIKFLFRKITRRI
tara:strand:- start:44 stop:295 length:252 start_codon:yes stop_codon:yes gene_type:complete